MFYHHLGQWKIQSLYDLKFYFLMFCQGYMQQKEVHQFLIYQERDFLHYLRSIELRFMKSNMLLPKNTEIVKGDASFIPFCLF